MPILFLFLTNRSSDHCRLLGNDCTFLRGGFARPHLADQIPKFQHGFLSTIVDLDDLVKDLEVPLAIVLVDTAVVVWQYKQPTFGIFNIQEEAPIHYGGAGPKPTHCAFQKSWYPKSTGQTVDRTKVINDRLRMEFFRRFFISHIFFRIFDWKNELLSTIVIVNQRVSYLELPGLHHLHLSIFSKILCNFSMQLDFYSGSKLSVKTLLVIE